MKTKKAKRLPPNGRKLITAGRGAASRLKKLPARKPAAGTLTSATIAPRPPEPAPWVRPEPPKESREDRHTGKRLVAINHLLDDHLKSCAMPLTPSILHIVAAFGLDCALPECGSGRQHLRPWASLNAAGEVADIIEGFYSFNYDTKGVGGQPKTFTREDVLWKHVAPLLRRRLSFRVSKDLLPAWKRADMERIAALVSFDYAAEWTKICTITLPPPKSWGKEIDPLTLEPTTMMAKWRLLKKGLASSSLAAAAPAGRKEKSENGATLYCYPAQARRGAVLGPVNDYWFTDDKAAVRGLEKVAKKQGYKVERVALGAVTSVEIAASRI